LSPQGLGGNVLRLLAAILVLPALSLIACGGSDEPSAGGVIIEPLLATATAEAAVIAPPPMPGTNGTSELHGFIMPIPGGCLPRGDQLMPNAARPYRNGIHEGVDFYQVDNCTAIANGTAVVAARAGRVIRADTNYKDPTQAEINAYLANPNTETSLDQFRRRHVRINHGGGVVTRYAHLSAIAPGITAGTPVTQGQHVGGVGESGTPESVSRPGNEYHLHFEIRLGAGCVAPTAEMTANCAYLGKDQVVVEVRRLYQTAFSP